MEIDGKRFYALVTGSETALEDLFNIIPKILVSKKLSHGIDEKSLLMTLQLFHSAFH